MTRVESFSPIRTSLPATTYVRVSSHNSLWKQLGGLLSLAFTVGATKPADPKNVFFNLSEGHSWALLGITAVVGTVGTFYLYCQRSGQSHATSLSAPYVPVSRMRKFLSLPKCEISLEDIQSRWENRFNPVAMFYKDNKVLYSEISKLLDLYEPYELMALIALSSFSNKSSAVKSSLKDRFFRVFEEYSIKRDSSQNVAFLDLRNRVDCDMNVIEAFIRASEKACGKVKSQESIAFASFSQHWEAWIRMLDKDPFIMAMIIDDLVRKVSPSSLRDFTLSRKDFKKFLSQHGVNLDNFASDYVPSIAEPKLLEPVDFVNGPSPCSLKSKLCQYSTEELMGLLALFFGNQPNLFAEWYERESRLFGNRQEPTFYRQMCVASLENENIHKTFIEVSRAASKRRESRVALFFDKLSTFKEGWLKLNKESNGVFSAEVLTVLLAKVAGMELSGSFSLSAKAQYPRALSRYKRFLSRLGFDLSVKGKAEEKKQKMGEADQTFLSTGTAAGATEEPTSHDKVIVTGP